MLVTKLGYFPTLEKTTLTNIRRVSQITITHTCVLYIAELVLTTQTNVTKYSNNMDIKVTKCCIMTARKVLVD